LDGRAESPSAALEGSITSASEEKRKRGFELRKGQKKTLVPGNAEVREEGPERKRRERETLLETKDREVSISQGGNNEKELSTGAKSKEKKKMQVGDTSVIATVKKKTQKQGNGKGGSRRQQKRGKMRERPKQFRGRTGAESGINRKRRGRVGTICSLSGQKFEKRDQAISKSKPGNKTSSGAGIGKRSRIMSGRPSNEAFTQDGLGPLGTFVGDNKASGRDGTKR